MGTSMKAAFIEQTGSPDKIKFGELPKPKISDNDVLVKVTYTTVDWIDTYIRSGRFKMKMNFPYILGHDFCGVVDSVGKNVKKFKSGDHVWSSNQGVDGRQGSCAEYVSINQEFLYQLPKGVNEKDAIAAVQAGLTACHGLIAKAKLMANETIFINGGSGNVGSALIQLSKAIGSKVIATAGSQEKMDWCRSLGADLAINYKMDDIEKEVLKFAPEGVNVYWDTTQEPNFEKSVPIAAKDGRLIVMSGSAARPIFPVGPFYNKDLTLLGFSIHHAPPEALKDYSEIINRCFQEGKLKIKIAETMPLSETSKAHQKQETDEKLWGKIVLTV